MLLTLIGIFIQYYSRVNTDIIKPLIAVINSNQDIIEMICMILGQEGYPTVTGHVIDFKRGKDNFVDYVQRNKPKIIIFDIAPPYEENWNYFKLVHKIKEAEHIPFIITTTNTQVLKKITGAKEPIEIVGKPFDLNEIVDAVKKAEQSF
jgi:DNA-binding response OmpR family regulator